MMPPIFRPNEAWLEERANTFHKRLIARLATEGLSTNGGLVFLALPSVLCRGGLTKMILYVFLS